MIQFMSLRMPIYMSDVYTSTQDKITGDSNYQLDPDIKALIQDVKKLKIRDKNINNFLTTLTDTNQINDQVYSSTKPINYRVVYQIMQLAQDL